MSSEKIQSTKINFIIALLLALVISLAFLVGFFMLRDNDSWDITKVFRNDEEHTMLLEEFVVNLKSDKGSKNYLKIQMALMYENEKDAKILSANTNKIRDIIIKQLRNKTAEEMLDIDKTMEFKKEIINDINVSFKQNIVDDIYFTDLVIQ